MVHPIFQNLINQAPVLKRGDYQGIVYLIKSWIERKIFRYSLLDVLLQPGVKIIYSKSKGFFIEGANNGSNLKYVHGTCFAQASKILFLLQIIYPWVDACFVEKNSWDSGGNHCYVVLSPSGIKKNTGEYINTNMFFGNPDRNYGSYRISWPNDSIVIDTVLGVTGPILHYPEHAGFDSCHSSVNLLTMEWGVYTPIKPEFYRNSYAFLHSQGGFSKYYIGLGAEASSEYLEEPRWFCDHDSKLLSFGFSSIEFLELVGKLDKEAAEKIMIIQNRGWELTD